MNHPSFEDVKLVDRHLADLRYDYYIHENLFTFQWWFLTILMVIPWILFILLVKKEYLIETLLFGSIISMITVFLDDLGVELQFWAYKYQFLKLIPRLNPVDYCILPVFYMLIYQYFREWKPYFIAVTLFSLFASFIAEPLFVWLDIYQMYNWQHYYSLPLYIIIPILVKRIMTLLKRISYN
jgi:hypothetical protein